MKNTRLTWATVFNARNRHWGINTAAAEAARAAGYQYMSFNERIYFVGTAKGPRLEETELTETDLATKQCPVIVDRIEFKDIDGREIMLTDSSNLLEPSAMLYITDTARPPQECIGSIHLNRENAYKLGQAL